MLVLGDARDARGFRLAGVSSAVCQQREDVERSLREFGKAGTTDGLLVISDQVYRLAPDLFDALSEESQRAVVLVLPGTGGTR
jgi:vacuolar-type H+-ATPase subunit F/Vma7